VWDEEFGHAELGDSRRTARLVRMAASLAERPGGKVLEVFRSNAEQQGAYDFLSNERIRGADLLAAMRSATGSGVPGSHGSTSSSMAPVCD